MSDQPSEFCPACGAPEGGRHDKVLHSIVDFEASQRVHSVAPSVDVEKLRVPARVLEAAKLIDSDVTEAMEILYGEIGGMDDAEVDVANTEKAIADDMRIVLAWVIEQADSTPVDYGPAETQYGVFHPGRVSVEAGFASAEYAQKAAVKATRRQQKWSETSVQPSSVAVTCEQRRTPWRPVDGAPGEDSQA